MYVSNTPVQFVILMAAAIPVPGLTRQMKPWLICQGIRTIIERQWSEEEDNLVASNQYAGEGSPTRLDPSYLW